MTRRRDFKALVREHMAKTGERYAVARAQLLAQRSAPLTSRPSFPGVVNGYDRFGGVQSGTAAVQHALRHADIVSPLDNAPYTEAMFNGLCGGPGFLYAVFEYKGWPPMLTLALRSRSMPDVYVAGGLSRLGVRMTQSETTSSVVARKALDQALSSDRPAVCVTDAASLPWLELPKEFVGGGPHVVAVVGRDGDDFWVDDRAQRPWRVSSSTLAKARAACRHARNRLISIEGPMPNHDARQAVRKAIADTAVCYVKPAVPKSFAVNCGFSGLDKWRQLLTDRKDKKGWPTLFADGARACAALQRLYECIECQSAPHAGRQFYADFLDETAGALAWPSLQRAATAFREAGTSWAAIAGLVANCSDPAVHRVCDMSNRRLELSDAWDAENAGESAALARSRQALAVECRLTKTDASALYADIAALVERVIDSERSAVALLHAALAA